MVLKNIRRLSELMSKKTLTREEFIEIIELISTVMLENRRYKELEGVTKIKEIFERRIFLDTIKNKDNEEVNDDWKLMEIIKELQQ